MTRVVLVSGASQGIGKAIAIRLLQEGAEVHGTFNTSGSSAEEMLADWPKSLHMHQVDFSNPVGVDSLIEVLSETRFDGLVNNAGIFEMDGFADWDYEVWRTVFTVNLDSPLRLTMGLRSQFNSGASIVNVSSLDGLVGSFHSMAYSASKAALISLTKSLANNFGRASIRVNTNRPRVDKHRNGDS